MGRSAGCGTARRRRSSGSAPRRGPPSRCRSLILLDLEREAVLVARERSPPPAAGRRAGSRTGCRGSAGRPPTRTRSGRASFERRRTGGIAPEVAAADHEVRRRIGRSHASRNPGVSRGSCWPSASSVSIAVAPSSIARRKPARSAAPLPWFGRCSTTVAPAPGRRPRSRRTSRRRRRSPGRCSRARRSPRRSGAPRCSRGTSATITRARRPARLPR